MVADRLPAPMRAGGKPGLTGVTQRAELALPWAMLRLEIVRARASVVGLPDFRRQALDMLRD